jgi:hypothetical protein
MSSPQQPDLAPPENQPGHHPPEEQDKPDLDKFAAKLGAKPKKTPAKAASRPAATAPEKSPAAPPKVAPTPAKRQAAAPTAQAESAPSPQEAARISAPQPEPEAEHEPRLVGLMLMPLRQTVKGLEQLDRTLSKRLSRKLQARTGLGRKGR